jgi:hypothetical protein
MVYVFFFFLEGFLVLRKIQLNTLQEVFDNESQSEGLKEKEGRNNNEEDKERHAVLR